MRRNISSLIKYVRYTRLLRMLDRGLSRRRDGGGNSRSANIDIADGSGGRGTQDLSAQSTDECCERDDARERCREERSVYYMVRLQKGGSTDQY